jgi:hypothetical protein
LINEFIKALFLSGLVLFLVISENFPESNVEFRVQ